MSNAQMIIALQTIALLKAYLHEKTILIFSPFSAIKAIKHFYSYFLNEEDKG